jgi:hypothetical protein
MGWVPIIGSLIYDTGRFSRRLQGSQLCVRRRRTAKNPNLALCLYQMARNNCFRLAHLPKPFHALKARRRRWIKLYL